MGELCNSVGVRGYPTIKHGDPNDMQDYKGGRDYDSLKKFADGLGPTCGPANLDLCDDDTKQKIEELTALSASKRKEKIKEHEASMEKLEKEFKTLVDSLHKKYED